MSPSGGDRVGVRATCDERDVHPGLEQSGADGTADRAGADDRRSGSRPRSVHRRIVGCDGPLASGAIDWLTVLDEVRAIAQTGLHYSTDPVRP